MKKYLLLVVLALFPIALYSQNNDLFLQEEGKHLTFRDVPIDGSLRAFTSQIEAKGFTLVYTPSDNSGAAFTGKFIGKEVTLLVITSPKTRTVWKVAVDFGDQRSWYSLKSDYRDLKNSLSVKYGIPTSYEYFRSPYEEGDGYEMTAIYAEKCVYVSYFDVKENDKVVGTIALSIEKHDTQGYVSLRYEDAVNASMASSEKNANIYDEL